MVLTIGMIVKNEAENLDRCLSSLQPIRDAVDTELIVVDTGSTDNTVDIAKKYTDEVRYFEWCKDFSAARNFSLQNAKGEWFMFIDADEWFGDSQEIVKFFKSGEYKKFKSASYIQRNYFTKEFNSVYTDGHVIRLTRIMPDTTFINPIHEQLSPILSPYKELKSFVHHFGYLELNDGSESKKRKRNIELLLNRIDSKNGNDVMAYIQLFDMYLNIDDEKAVESVKTGLELNRKINENEFFDYVCMKLMVIGLNNLKKDYEALEVINEYFSERAKDKVNKDVIVTDIELYALKTIICSQCNETAQAVDAYNMFVPLFKKYKKGHCRTNDLYICTLKFVSDRSFTNITCILLDCLVKNNKLNSAFEIRKNALYSDVIAFFGYPLVISRIDDDLNIAFNLDRLNLIADLFSQLSNDAKAMDILENKLLEKIFNKNPDKEKLISFISGEIHKFNFSDRFRKCLELYNIMYGNRNNNSYDFTAESGLAEKIIEMIKDFDVIPLYLADIAFFAFKFNMPVKNILQKIDVKNLNSYARQFNSDIEFMKAVVSYIETYNSDNSDEFEYEWISTLILNIINQKSKLCDFEIVSVFRKYAILSKKYIDKVYKSAVINDDMIICLPVKNQIGYYSFKAITAFDNMDTKTCVFYMKSAALLDLELKRVASALGKVASEAVVDNYSVPKSNDETEFDILAAQIKSNIKAMISNGDNVQASKLIDEYRQINPLDSDIDILSGQVKAKLID